MPALPLTTVGMFQPKSFGSHPGQISKAVRLRILFLHLALERERSEIFRGFS